MYLKSLEITGFKSFGKKAYLEFTSPISAIVGPNGSGKSNIAEAFRFVLGEQSIKSLRGKKGEDLIFNGGKSLPRQNRGSVKVLFDNRKRILNIDFDEVTIERIVNRDGTNEYKINSSEVRLKDVVELLSSAHIGSSGHHIISQGEADRMLNSSLQERKSILEEALGLKMYQHKKEDGEKKLEKTELNMKETESLLREIAPHLRFLKKQYEKIEKAEGIRGELLENGKIYFRNETDYVEKKSDDISKRHHNLDGNLKELKSKREKLQSSLGRHDKHDKEEITLSGFEDERKVIVSKKDIKTREIGNVEGEIAYIVRAIKKIEEDEDSIHEIKVSLKDLEDVKDEIFKLESLEEAKKILDKFISKYRNEKKIHGELQGLKEELSSLEKKKKEYSLELETFKIEEDEINKKITEERNKKEDEKQKSFEAEREMIQIESEIHEKEENLIRLTAEKTLFEEEKAILKNDLQELTHLLGRDVLAFENMSLSNTIERSGQHEMKRVIERLKIRLEEAGISNAPEVRKEYKDTEERDIFLRKELVDLESSKDSLLEMIKDLEAKIDVEFKSGIKKINDEFNDLFKLMFGGGQARLEVVDEPVKKKHTFDGDDFEVETESGMPFEAASAKEGIDIHVELPHKKTKGLVMLSGGERALTSIALLFAMSQVNPPPFIILDETDAALDEANSKKYGDMIEKLSSHSELILITHNRETMSRAGVIYGITMASEGTSKLLSIKFDEAVAIAK